MMERKLSLSQQIVGSGESWISDRIVASYVRLHRLGHAHSIECWQEEELVGGLYGVGFDRVFCGESMFSRVPDSSKVALAWLVAARVLQAIGAALLTPASLSIVLAAFVLLYFLTKRLHRAPVGNT